MWGTRLSCITTTKPVCMPLFHKVARDYVTEKSLTGLPITLLPSSFGPNIEISLAVVCACLPTYRVIYTKHLKTGGVLTKGSIPLSDQSPFGSRNIRSYPRPFDRSRKEQENVGLTGPRAGVDTYIHADSSDTPSSLEDNVITVESNISTDNAPRNAIYPTV